MSRARAIAAPIANTGHESALQGWLAMPYQWFGLACTVGLMWVAHRLWPDSGQREPIAYGFVSTLGYAHFIGAAWYSRGRMARFVPRGVPPVLFALFVFFGLLNLFVLYAKALGIAGGWAGMSYTWVLLALLATVTWHTLENELEMKAGYDEARPIGGVSRLPARHLVAVGWTSAVLLVVASTLRQYGPFANLDLIGFRLVPVVAAGALLAIGPPTRDNWIHAGAMVAIAVAAPNDTWRWLSFSDLYLGVSLYHLTSWIALLLAKARRFDSQERIKRFKGLAFIHVVPMAIGLVAWILASPELREWLFSPGAYLFWTAAHIGQTVLVRGVATSPRA